MLSGLLLVFGWACNRPDVTYDQALQQALERDDPKPCNTITQGRFFGDYSESAASSRLYCVAEFTAMRRDVLACARLDAVRPEHGSSQRHACLERLANQQRTLAACSRIAYPEGDARAAYDTLYHDRCRARAIWDPAQCSGTFVTDHWAEVVAGDCIPTIAINTRDPAVCEQLEHGDAIEACRRRVVLATGPPHR